MKIKLSLFLFLTASSLVTAQQTIKYEHQVYDVTPSASWIKSETANQYSVTSLFNNKSGGYGVVLSTQAEMGRQVICTATDQSLYDSIQKYNDLGFSISNIEGIGKSGWVISFSKQKRPQQKVLTDNSFPSDQIRKHSVEGYKLEAVTGNGTQWLALMSQAKDFETQDFQIDTYIPRAFIKDYWDQDFSITDVSYCQGTWAVIMSKTEKISLQVYAAQAEFPTEWIREKWKNGYRITSVAYGSEWLVVMSKF